MFRDVRCCMCSSLFFPPFIAHVPGPDCARVGDVPLLRPQPERARPQLSHVRLACLASPCPTARTPTHTFAARGLTRREKDIKQHQEEDPIKMVRQALTENSLATLEEVKVCCPRHRPIAVTRVLLTKHTTTRCEIDHTLTRRLWRPRSRRSCAWRRTPRWRPRSRTPRSSTATFLRAR